MAISVICPHCFKRFQVSERFGGMKGPCPNCRGVIEIPKANVTVHAPDEVVESGKASKKRIEAHPIRRLEMDFSVAEGLRGLGMVASVVVVTWLLGQFVFTAPSALKSLVAVVAMTALCVPITAFGYLVMRDQESLFVWAGRDLYLKSMRLGGAYALLWIFYEIAIRYTSAIHDPIFIWVALVPCVVFSAIAAVVLFDFDFPRGLMHACIAIVAIIFLRGIFGLGWLWHIAAAAGRTGGAASPWSQ